MIKLEFFGSNDFQKLIEWITDEEFLFQWAGSQFIYPLSEEQLNNYIDGTNDKENSDTLIYKAILEDTGEYIGHISLGGIDRNNKSGRIGKVLVGSSPARGRGIGQEIVRAILKIGFGELKLHRISLRVFDFNQTAIRCYEKVGFSKEGFLREARKYKDTYWNLIQMSILEQDWRRNKKE